MKRKKLLFAVFAAPIAFSIGTRKSDVLHVNEITIEIAERVIRISKSHALAINAFSVRVWQP